jgi:uncharacterized linocin/CFP29 family protein
VSGPIKPGAVLKAKTRQIPDVVFDAFNELIARNFRGRYAIVHQDDVVEEIMRRAPDTLRTTIYEQQWLDVEDAYRAEGWSVEYDKPGYNESYRPLFRFRVGRPS